MGVMDAVAVKGIGSIGKHYLPSHTPQEQTSSISCPRLDNPPDWTPQHASALAAKSHTASVENDHSYTRARLSGLPPVGGIPCDRNVVDCSRGEVTETTTRPRVVMDSESHRDRGRQPCEICPLPRDVALTCSYGNPVAKDIGYRFRIGFGRFGLLKRPATRGRIEIVAAAAPPSGSSTHSTRWGS